MLNDDAEAPGTAPQDLGWDERWAALASAEASVGEPARIVRVDRGAVQAVSISCPDGATSARYDSSLRGASLGVGDWVLMDDDVVVAVLPRRTELARESAGGTSQEQVLAANIDVVVIVEHLDPAPLPGRVERLLALAWQSGAQPIVVATKADLLADDTEAKTDRIASLVAAAPGVDVLVTSAESGEGMDLLSAQLGVGRTFVLLGPSGAGKSTLTNWLAGHEVMEVGTRRESDGKGRHTTTHRELIVVPGRGVIIDTPGLRTVSVVATPDAVAATFEDIAELAEGCKFSDCAHASEPGCAVQDAIADGTLERRRFESYLRIMREAERHELRAGQRAAAAGGPALSTAQRLRSDAIRANAKALNRRKNEVMRLKGRPER